MQPHHTNALKWSFLIIVQVHILTITKVIPHQSSKMVTSILNENLGLSLERIGHQIIILLIIVQVHMLTITKIIPHQSSKMVTSILNENPGLSLERIGHQIIILLRNVHVHRCRTE